jgi:hypothetical protein
MAWCALIALHIARQDDGLYSEAQESLFITRWLAEAKRTRRFPRGTSRDIDWLLNQGRKFGVQAKLHAKLDFLWKVSTGSQEDQPDLYRLSQALDIVREYHWTYQVVSDEHWQGRKSLKLNSSVNGVYVLKSSLNDAFDDQGNQTSAVQILITGRTDELQTLFNSCGWKVMPENGDRYTLVTANFTKKTLNTEPLYARP